MLADVQERPRPAERPVTLEHIPPDHLGGVWPLIKDMVPSIVERSKGRHTLQTLIDAVRAGKIEIDLAWDGEAVLGIMGTQIGYAPSGIVVATIRFAVGRDSHRWLHLMEQHEDVLRARGVTKVEIIARKGWAQKLPSYQMTHVFLEKDL